MQFIDFKKEHFTQDEETKDFVIDISKEEIGFGEITIQEKTDDDTFTDADYEIKDDLNKVTIKMKKPTDIRVNF